MDEVGIALVVIAVFLGHLYPVFHRFAGGKGVAQPLSARDQQIAQALGPGLAAKGLLLVGLDIIGPCLTEVNVTSPTCFREITDQTGFDVAALFVDALEEQVKARASQQ